MDNWYHSMYYTLSDNLFTAIYFLYYVYMSQKDQANNVITDEATANNDFLDNYFSNRSVENIVNTAGPIEIKGRNNKPIVLTGRQAFKLLNQIAKAMAISVGWYLLQNPQVTKWLLEKFLDNFGPELYHHIQDQQSENEYFGGNSKSRKVRRNKVRRNIKSRRHRKRML